MSDTSINRFLAQGDDAAEAAFTPVPPTPASGPDPLQLFLNTETTPDLKYWDGANFTSIGGGGSGTVTNSGTLTDHQIVVANGGVDVSTLGALGSAGEVLTSNGAGADPSWQAASGGGSVPVGVVNGRLTLTTGVPITTADVIGASTLYFTPYLGNQIALYDGADWQLETFAELSLALSGLTSGKNYDVFIDYNGGTPQIILGTAWTNDTTRAVALTTQDGVLVLTGATDHRYVGTIRTTGTTTTEDSAGTAGTTQVGGNRFVWNYYNRLERQLLVVDTTASWSYTTGTWRVSNGATAPLNAVQYVVGVSEDPVVANVTGSQAGNNQTANVAAVGIGVDSATAPSSQHSGTFSGPNSNVSYFGMAGNYRGFPGIGYHYLAWLEVGAGTTCLFKGQEGEVRSGLSAFIKA